MDAYDNARVEQLPAHIGNLKELKTLFIANNKISRFPASLANLTLLNKLDISGMQLTALPESICRSLSTRVLSPVLIQLSLRELIHMLIHVPFSPHIFWFSDCMSCSLRKVTKLGLQGNDLRDIPECFAKLTKLSNHGLLKVTDALIDCSNIRLMNTLLSSVLCSMHAWFFVWVKIKNVRASH